MILDAAARQQPFAVSALAVHGVMTGVRDDQHRYRLNHLDLATPDGQPVRWALFLLHGIRLRRRTTGSTLLDMTCAAAAQHGLPVFFYGSRPDVLEQLIQSLTSEFPTLTIAGAEPSKFRRSTATEKQEIVNVIRQSGARIVFVGLGCPRQEVFAFEYRELLGMPVVAIGAAFDYRAGTLRRPSSWARRLGLEWLYRFAQEPRRLWKRYLVLNPAFATLLCLQALGLWRPSPSDVTAPDEELLYA